jgi:hypothetical protein
MPVGLEVSMNGSDAGRSRSRNAFASAENE